MKKYLLILILAIAVKGYSQTRTSTTKLNENTVVKDDAGTVLTYDIWQKLLQTGEYQLKKPQDSTFFTIFRMSAAQKVMADERRKKLAESMPKPKSSDAFKDGEKFKGERITDINGNKFDLKTATAKIYVLNFWFINCPPCKKEIPELNTLVNQYKDNKDVVFLAIALDEKFELVDFLKTTPFNYNIVSGKYYANKYGVRSFPTHVIVGKDGLIKFSTIGLAPNTIFWLEKTIKEQLTTL